MRKRVLVTGGAGYIGSHTCKALARAGYEPVALDNLSTGYRHNVKWGPLEVADIADSELVRRIIRQYQPVSVIHFAGSAYVGESMFNPGKYYKNNTVATYSFIEVLVQEMIEVIVFSSTCATYGIPEYLPLDTSHPQNPISPYGFSKFVSERMIIDFSRVYGQKYGLLRYFNAAGADEEGDLKEEHCPETHLIPLAIANAFGAGPKLKIFGNDYPTFDGTCVRDYIHVSALSEAHVKTMERLVRGETKSEIRNLGSGRGYSIMEILSSIHRVTGRKVDAEFAGRRNGDPPELWAKSDKEFSATIDDNHLDRIISSVSFHYS